MKHVNANGGLLSECNINDPERTHTACVCVFFFISYLNYSTTDYDRQTPCKTTYRGYAWWQPCHTTLQRFSSFGPCMCPSLVHACVAIIAPQMDGHEPCCHLWFVSISRTMCHLPSLTPWCWSIFYCWYGTNREILLYVHNQDILLKLSHQKTTT